MRARYHSITVVATALTAALAVGTGACTQSIAAPLVKVTLLSGAVRAVGWDGSQVKVTPEGAVRIRRSGEDVFITGIEKEGQDDPGPQVTVQLPAGSRLKVRTVSASISAEGLRGPAQLRSVSGSIEARSLAGGLRARSVSGAVRVERSAGDLRLRSVSGSVEVRGGTVGRLKARTVSGEIRVDGVALHRGTLRSISGHLTVHPKRVSSALRLKTMSGDAKVKWPGAGVTVDARTRSGALDLGGAADAKTLKRKTGGWGGQQLVVTLGGGGPRLRFRSFSGNLRLRR